ncbi:Atg14 domain-containing protein [Geomonas sp. RF6]|uniref:MotE family protein n=1 Tax=Geomonas sp. RF6 TaxID=2897342 RepID=UPI001E401DAA|nr:Atg14 domain-containing protein [Geomonas sp. RF6]UFS72331.1 Atg14 domain-containing protein [Geomonas sp. RF6]
MKGKVLLAVLFLTLGCSSLLEARGAAGSGRPAPDEGAAALELKRQQLAEREAAVKAKEDALRKLSAQVEARIRELDAAKKGLEGSLAGKKKLDEERYKKMLKIYKALKPEQAADLMNKLDEPTVIGMLNQMDQKTAVKLIPLLTQPRVLKWSRENLAVP